jgi:hypothetical protein
MNSSDWCAKEKECNDSDGNRVRSSVNIVGEAGPGDKAPEELFREPGSVRLIEFERGAIDAARDELVEGGRVGARGGGCCRIRRRPDAPRPCSCSVITGDLPGLLSMISNCQVLTKDETSRVTNKDITN